MAIVLGGCSSAPRPRTQRRQRRWHATGPPPSRRIDRRFRTPFRIRTAQPVRQPAVLYRQRPSLHGAADLQRICRARRASWYGTEFHGLKTSTGEPYDMFAMTAAHKTLPLPCYARVTNLTNGHSVVVRINDRGPFVDNRIIDLSYSAASRLDMIRHGTAFVQVEVITPASPSINASLPVNVPAASSAAVGVSSVPPPAIRRQLRATAPPAGNAAGFRQRRDRRPRPPLQHAVADTTPRHRPRPPPSSTFYIQVGAYTEDGECRQYRSPPQSRRHRPGDHARTQPPRQPLAARACRPDPQRAAVRCAVREADVVGIPQREARTGLISAATLAPHEKNRAPLAFIMIALTMSLLP